MKTGSFLLLVLFCFFNQAQAQRADRPNIIFILVDDMGWGDLGIYYQNQRQRVGDRSEPWEYSPNLDTMASQGAVLTQHYAAAPVCAPSRASILLGVSQGHANVRDNQFDKVLEDNYTMASTLRQLGYTTSAIGKWGLQGVKNEKGEWPGHPLNRGFDYFFGYMRHKDGHEHYPKEGLYDGPKEVWKNRENIVAGLDKCYTADLWTAMAKKWIVDHKSGNEAARPFFMYLAFDTPHAVLELPTQPYPAGGGLQGGLQWIGQPGKMINTASGKIDTYIHPDYQNATWDDDKDPSTAEVPWPAVFKRYATATRRIDNAVGDIIRLLTDLEIEQNTMIVFTSDNGPSRESYLPEGFRKNTPDFFNSFGPFDGIKRDCWEGGIRMPALVWWPGHIQPHEVSSPSISYDWAPTFLDAAGTQKPARMDGVSLLPALTGEPEPPERTIYIEYYHNGSTPAYTEFNATHRNRTRNQMQVIRKGKYLGVRYDIQSARDPFEIYDIENDPQQTRNLTQSGDMDTLQRWMQREVLRRRRPESQSPRPYDGEEVPDVSLKASHQGIRWNTYPGTDLWVPDISGLTSAKTGVASTLEAIPLDRKSTMCLDGYISVPKDGEYEFFLNAVGGAVFRIHDATVIDADYGYTGGDRSGKINLKKGLHPYRIYYLNTGTSPSLKLEWSTSEFSRQEIPAENWVLE